ncbi:MAG: transcriptional regulator [Streptosporangiaceae bacterium]
MHNPWLALEAGADPDERLSLVRTAHEAFLSTGAVSPRMRRVVAESWQRSMTARVDPDRALPPVSLTDGALEDYRSGHPLAAVVPVVRELLGGLADEGRHLMAITDAAGRLLWVEGNPAVLAEAERMHFVEGALWDERHAGTNAPGTALAVDHAVQIFAAEHYSRPVQPWTCSAAPIHDPVSGAILGAIDVTGGDHLAVPVGLALVQAAARAVEAELGRRAMVGEQRLRRRYLDRVGRHESDTALVDGTGRVLMGGPESRPSLTLELDAARGLAILPDGREAETEPFDGSFIVRWPHAVDRRSGLQLTCLGSTRLVEDGVRVTLSPRQTEILVLLTLDGKGMSPERLRESLYGDRHVAPATLKAEVSHLRRTLHGALSTRRYELTVPIRCDAVEVLDGLRAGDLDRAVAFYQGPLLPESEAPGIVVWRDHLEVALREAVLRARLPGAALAYGGLHPEDLQVHERALKLLGADDPRRGIALARYRTALDD